MKYPEDAYVLRQTSATRDEALHCAINRGPIKYRKKFITMIAKKGLEPDGEVIGPGTYYSNLTSTWVTDIWSLTKTIEVEDE